LRLTGPLRRRGPLPWLRLAGPLRRRGPLPWLRLAGPLRRRGPLPWLRLTGPLRRRGPLPWLRLAGRLPRGGRLPLANGKGRLRRAVIGILVLDNDRAAFGILVAELRHRGLDRVRGSSCHHAQGRNLIRPANLDALLLEHGPQHQGVPVRGALDRPGHLHYSN